MDTLISGTPVSSWYLHYPLTLWPFQGAGATGILYWLTVIGKHKQGIVQENCNSQIINEMELNYNSHFFFYLFKHIKSESGL